MLNCCTLFTLLLSVVTCRFCCWSRARHMRTFLPVPDARNGIRVLRRRCCMPSAERWPTSTATSISTTAPSSSRTPAEFWLRRPGSRTRGISPKFRTRSSFRCPWAEPTLGVCYVSTESVSFVLEQFTVFFGTRCVYLTLNAFLAVAIRYVDTCRIVLLLQPGRCAFCSLQLGILA